MRTPLSLSRLHSLRELRHVCFEHLRALRLLAVDRPPKRITAVYLVAASAVGALIQQTLHALGVAIVHGNHQRRHALVVGVIDLCFGLRKQPHGVDIIVLRRYIQRCAA